MFKNNEYKRNVQTRNLKKKKGNLSSICFTNEEFLNPIH